FRKQRRGGNGHGGIGDVVQVDVDALQRAATDFYPGLTPAHGCTHLPESIGKAHITLYAGGTTAIHAYRTARNRSCRQEVGGRRRITLDHELPRGAIVLTRADDEAAVILVDHFYAEFGHHIQGDEDVGLRDEIAFHQNFEVTVAERCCHQHGGEELAGDITLDADLAAAQAIRGDAQRRIVCVAKVADRCAAAPQAVYQVADGALIHTLLPGQDELS